MVSIIIPVYNAEKFIDEAIQSVMAQTYKNFELLLINDGSTDNSGYICRCYAENNSQVKFHDKVNEGVSKTRNYGIDHAEGEYLMFVDADDTLPENAVEILMNAMSQGGCDVVYAGHCLVYDDKKIPKFSRLKNGVYEYEQLKDRLLDDGTLTGILFGSVWGACYSARFVHENNIRFRTNVRVNEDGLFNMEAIRLCRAVHVIDETVYNYRQWKNSKRIPLSRDQRFDESEPEILRYVYSIGDQEMYDIQIRRRRVSVAFWNSLRIQNSDAKYRENRRYLKKIFDDPGLKKCYKDLNYNGMNVYKETLCFFMRHKLLLPFYVSVRCLMPILSKILKR